MYLYSEGNPINLIDISGLASCDNNNYYNKIKICICDKSIDAWYGKIHSKQ